MSDSDPPPYGDAGGSSPPPYQDRPSYDAPRSEPEVSPFDPPPSSGWTGPPLARWGQRVLAALVDGLIPGAVFIGLTILSGATDLFLGAFFGWTFFIGFTLWNLVQQGVDGQTVGKRVVGLKLLRLENGYPVGPLKSVGRYVVRYALGSITFSFFSLIDYLFPLWDPLRQTLTDKMFRTVVIFDPAFKRPMFGSPNAPQT